MKTKFILLVDDTLLDVALTLRAVADCNVPHEVVIANDGEEGLFQLERQRFDAILVDIKMPRVDGFDMMERMRSKAPHRKTPVFVLSGSTLEADRTRAAKLGAIEYVTKELDYVDFKRNLKKALGRHGFC
jgi:CheY-like chemotaxis protein